MKKKTEFFDELSERLCDAMPDAFKNIKNDLEKNFRVILQSTFNKFDLVTREEFDAQTKVLARTRKKLEALEKQLHDLEKTISKK